MSFWAQKLSMFPMHLHYSQTSEYYLAVSDFYLNPDYILWYKNLASFVVTLLLPLILLAFYNCSTYNRINQRWAAGQPT